MFGDAGSAMTASAPVLILGMHRSGTSCLAGSLQQRGLHLGEVYESRPYNRKGNRENQQVMDLNNAVLAASGGAWDRPPRQLRWDPADEAARDAIIAGLGAGSADAPWGFKDPRSLLTLPFWQVAIPDARLVGTFRHPARVAASLRARDPGMAVETALELWRDYNERLLAACTASPFPIVDFDAEPDAYRRALDNVAAALGLSSPEGGDVFFEVGLRSPNASGDIAVPEAQHALHAALREAAAAWR
jgi:hypothetical protein